MRKWAVQYWWEINKTWATSVSGVTDGCTSNLLALRAFWDTELHWPTIITSLTANWGTELHSTLPEGYTELEYIWADWDQYLNTLVNVSENTKIETNIYPTTTWWGWVFGCLTTPEEFSLMASYSWWAYTWVAWFGSVMSSSFNLWVSMWNKIEMSSAGIFVDWVSQWAFQWYSFTSDNKLLLLWHPTLSWMSFNWRMWVTSIYENGMLVRKLIPAKSSTNVVWMYDIVNWVMYTNLRSGSSFIEWPAVSTIVPTPEHPANIVCNNGAIKYWYTDLPGWYTKLEYIEWTSNLTLNNKTTNNTEIEAKWYRRTSTAQYLYNSDSGSALTTNTTAYISARGNWRFGNKAITMDFAELGTYTTIQSKDWIWVNWEKEYEYWNVWTFTSTDNLKVFGGVPEHPLRLYYLKQSESWTLVWHYIPCKYWNDVWLYDLVWKEFYTNSWIIAWPEIPRLIYIEWTQEKISITGNLFDKTITSNILDWYISNVSAWESTRFNAYTGWDKTIKIQANPNTTYTAVRKIWINWFYDRIRVSSSADGWTSNQTMLLNQMDTTSISWTFTTLADTQRVYINVRNSGTVWDDWQEYLDNFMLVEGSTVPESYKPYVTPKTVSAEYLNKVWDYTDTQEFISGAITRNVGVKVFDGTENWQLYTYWLYNTPYLIMNDMIETTAGTPSDNFKCTHFAYKSSVWTSDTIWLSVSTMKRMFFKRIYNDTVEDFKAWLAAQYAAWTPVIVVYPLATPVTQTVTWQSVWHWTIVNIIQASISWLTYTKTEWEQTIPTPEYPMDVVCNNGTIKRLLEWYTQLEYIGFNWWTAINTGISAQETDRVIFDANIETQSSGDRYLTHATNTWVDIAGLAGSWYIRFGSNSSAVASISTWDILQRNTYELYKNNFDINGVGKAAPAYSSIRGTWEIGHVGANCATGHYYYYIIKNDTTGAIRFNWIPAKRNSDNVIWMYDLVSNTFFTNAWTWSFTAWPEIARWVYIEWIQEKIMVTDETNLLPANAEVWELYPTNITEYTTFVASAKVNDGSTSKLYAEVRFYDVNKTQLDYWALSEFNNWRMRKKFAININAKYYAIALKDSHPDWTTITDLKIEKWDTPTPYISPKTVSAGHLNKVWDYIDTQEFISGTITRNVGIKVLTWTENWNVASQYYIKSDACDWYILESNMYNVHYLQSIPGYCSHLMYTKSAPIWQTVGYPNMFQFNNRQIHLNISNDLLWITDYTQETTSSVLLKIKSFIAAQYANGTPIIIVYPLATPTTETTTQQSVPFPEWKVTATVTESSITPLDVWITYRWYN